MTSTAQDTSPTQAPPAKPRDWAPRIWEGCHFVPWMRLLFRNRFAVHWSCSYIAVIVTAVSFVHMLLRWVEQLWFGRAIARTPIRDAPIFIIGHWRSGTTLLHELLILDERHTYPTTYECLEPNHFLLTEGLVTRWLSFLMPSRRPMDNMKAGWDRPQEDEFALCMLGAHSPYLSIAFPNRPPLDLEYLEMKDVPPRGRERWKKIFFGFLQRLTFKTPKRLVLKSPPHTCRIPVLLELFPDARFVHIVRDPYVVYPSTVNLWKSLSRAHGFQRPTFAGLDEQVFQNFVRMYERLEETRNLAAPERFHELRYEELVRDPVGQMRTLYERLGLGEFDKVLPRLEEYLASVAGYETNRYQLTPEQRAEIGRRWGDVIRRYGYENEELPSA
jgi:hypothetical protein